MNDAIMIIIM